MADTSFLTQLEQRTQQVKITLANLEAEKTRIEGLIQHLQPLIPHYDALLDAERRLAEADVPLHPPELAPPHAEPPREPQAWTQESGGEQRQPEHPWQG